MQDLRADAIVAQVVRIAELEVGFHGIQTLFLKFVSLEFRRQADASAFLPQVEQDASFLGDAAHGGVQLAAAVAAAGAEDITRQAFTMHAHQRGFVRGDFPVNQGQVESTVQLGFIEAAGKVTVVCGHVDGFHQPDLLFLGPAVFNELGYGAGFQTMFFWNPPRSPMRAMVPSSFMISQQTPAGWRPAMRTRSMVASVWPARRSTPPGTARRGNV